MQQSSLETDCPGGKKGLGVLINNHMDMNYQCALADMKAKSMLGCMSKKSSQQVEGKGVFPLHHTQEQGAMLKGVQQRATTTDLGPEHLLCRGAVCSGWRRKGSKCCLQLSWCMVIWKTEPHFLQSGIAKGQGAMAPRYREKKITVRVVQHWKHIGQTSCGISIFRYIENSTGHGLEKPGLIFNLPPL